MSCWRVKKIMTNTTSSSSGRTVVVAWGTILTVCIFSILLHGPQHITSNEHREDFTLGYPDSEAWTCAHVSPSFRSFRPSCRPSRSVEWPVELAPSCLTTMLPTSTQYQNSGISTTDTQPSQPMAHKKNTMRLWKRRRLFIHRSHPQNSKPWPSLDLSYKSLGVSE